jgi:hypothetical protein
MMIAGLATLTNGRLIIILLLHSLVISLVHPSRISLLYLALRFSEPLSVSVLLSYGMDLNTSHPINTHLQWIISPPLSRSQSRRKTGGGPA